MKRTKFRFVFRAKKAQISFLISFCKKKIRTFRIVFNAFRKILYISQNFVKLWGIDLYSLPILSFKPHCESLTTYERFRVCAYWTFGISARMWLLWVRATQCRSNTGLRRSRLEKHPAAKHARAITKHSKVNSFRTLAPFSLGFHRVIIAYRVSPSRICCDPFIVFDEVLSVLAGGNVSVDRALDHAEWQLATATKWLSEYFKTLNWKLT